VSTADTLAGLHVERASYIARGLPARVAQVDAEIERLSALLGKEVAGEAEPSDTTDGAAHDHGAESDDAQEAATSVNPDDIARRARRGSAKA
jgi:hypothetical protein